MPKIPIFMNRIHWN